MNWKIIKIEKRKEKKEMREEDVLVLVDAAFTQYSTAQCVRVCEG